MGTFLQDLIEQVPILYMTVRINLIYILVITNEWYNLGLYNLEEVNYAN